MGIIKDLIREDSPEEILEDCEHQRNCGGSWAVSFTSWELSFLENLRDQIDGEASISAKQIEKLKEIRERFE